MKYISKIISIAILMIGFSLTSCEKWTEVENKEIDPNGIGIDIVTYSAPE